MKKKCKKGLKYVSYFCGVNKALNAFGNDLDFLAGCWPILVLEVWTVFDVHQGKGMHWIGLISTVINELPFCLREQPHH